MDQQPIEEAPALSEEQILGLPGGVNEGMTVVDRAEQVVGTVQLVYYGGASAEAVERAMRLQELAATLAPATEGSTFSSDVPPDQQERMLRYGYIRIEGPGITGLHSYVTPEQIAGVVGDQVQLHASREELVSPGA